MKENGKKQLEYAVKHVSGPYGDMTLWEVMDLIYRRGNGVPEERPWDGDTDYLDPEAWGVPERPVSIDRGSREALKRKRPLKAIVKGFARAIGRKIR